VVLSIDCIYAAQLANLQIITDRDFFSTRHSSQKGFSDAFSFAESISLGQEITTSSTHVEHPTQERDRSSTQRSRSSPFLVVPGCASGGDKCGELGRSEQVPSALLIP